MEEKNLHLYKWILGVNIALFSLQGAVIYFRSDDIVWFLATIFVNVIISGLLSDENKKRADLPALYTILFVTTLIFSVIITLALVITGNPIWWAVVLAIVYITEIVAVLRNRRGKQNEI